MLDDVPDSPVKYSEVTYWKTVVEVIQGDDKDEVKFRGAKRRAENALVPLEHSVVVASSLFPLTRSASLAALHSSTPASTTAGSHISLLAETSILSEDPM